MWHSNIDIFLVIDQPEHEEFFKSKLTDRKLADHFASVYLADHFASVYLAALSP